MVNCIVKKKRPRMANFNNLDITYRKKYCGAVASESGGFVV